MAAGWSSMPELLFTPDQVAAELPVWAAGFLAGWDHALVAVAANAAELTPDVVARGELLNRDRLAERLAKFEECRVRLAERMGRPAGYEYRGGPVAWDAGEVWWEDRLIAVPELVERLAVRT
jgi:hypothetical protein